MKLFLDTAYMEEIEETFSWGIVDGVTTNPTHTASREQCRRWMKSTALRKQWHASDNNVR